VKVEVIGVLNELGRLWPPFGNEPLKLEVLPECDWKQSACPAGE
jgi:hypothetical protein